MDNSTFYTLINAFLYGGLFIKYFRNPKKNYIGLLLLALYYIASVFSVISYIEYGYCKGEITLVPFIFLFIVLYIAFNPILKYNDTRINYITPIPLSVSNTIAVFFLFLLVPATIFLLFIFITTFREVLVDVSIVASLYDDTAAMVQSSGRQGSNIDILCGLFSEIIVFYTGFYLTLNKKNKIIVALLLFSTLYPLLNSFMSGSRTGMTYWIIEVLITYAIFRKFYNHSTLKIFNTVVISLLSLFLLVMTILTIGRFTRSGSFYDPMESVVLYAGKPMLNFDAYALQEEEQLDGDNTAPIFRKLLGLEASDDLFERQSKWARKLKAPDGTFYTFVGDFCFDFGFIGLFVLILIIPCFFYVKKKKSGSIPLYKLFLIFFWACVCCNGLFYFSYKTIGGNLKIICSILFYFLLRFVYVNVTLKTHCLTSQGHLDIGKQISSLDN